MHHVYGRPPRQVKEPSCPLSARPGFLLHSAPVNRPNASRSTSALPSCAERSAAMAGYVPGLQPGPGESLVKLNTNENPYPPSPRVLEALRAAPTHSLRLYPNPAGARRCASRRHARTASPRSRCSAATAPTRSSRSSCARSSARAKPIGYFQPSYSLYPVLAAIAGARTVEVPLPRRRARRGSTRSPCPAPRRRCSSSPRRTRPTGSAFPPRGSPGCSSAFPGIVVADEAYVDFADESSLPLLAAHPAARHGADPLQVLLARRHAHRARLRATPRWSRRWTKVKDSYNVEQARAGGRLRGARRPAPTSRATRDRIRGHPGAVLGGGSPGSGSRSSPRRPTSCSRSRPRRLGRPGACTTALLARGFPRALLRRRPSSPTGCASASAPTQEMDGPRCGAVEEDRRWRSARRSRRSIEGSSLDPPDVRGGRRAAGEARRRRGLRLLSLGNPDVEPPAAVQAGPRGDRRRAHRAQARLHAQRGLPRGARARWPRTSRPSRASRLGGRRRRHVLRRRRRR